MRNHEFKKVKYEGYPTFGRCVKCDARDICYLCDVFKCDCDLTQHYINIKKERKEKLEKLKNV